MLSLIYRVVSVDKSRYRYAVILLAAIVAADSLIFFFIATFQCRYVANKIPKSRTTTNADDACSPPQAYWTLSVTPQACINETKHLLAAGCINTTTDFLIVLVPIPYVRRLRLPRKQQIIVASLFAGGIFVTAAGAVRTAVTFISFSDPNKDLTWNAIPVIITSALELYVGIVSDLSAFHPPPHPEFPTLPSVAFPCAYHQFDIILDLCLHSAYQAFLRPLSAASHWQPHLLALAAVTESCHSRRQHGQGTRTRFLAHHGRSGLLAHLQRPRVPAIGHAYARAAADTRHANTSETSTDSVYYAIYLDTRAVPKHVIHPVV